jgi:hypothetical protein
MPEAFGGRGSVVGVPGPKSRKIVEVAGIARLESIEKLRE